MRRSGLYYIVTILLGLVFIFFFGKTILYIIVFALITLLLIFIGIIISAFLGKKDGDKKTKVKKEEKKEFSNSIKTYFNKYNVLPINETISLSYNNNNDIEKLNLCYCGEIIESLNEVKSDNYNLYQKIMLRINDYSNADSRTILTRSRQIKNFNIQNNISIKQIDFDTINGMDVVKPEPRDIEIEDYYSTYILKLLNSVYYSQESSKDYCKGHNDAISKYFKQIKKESNNINTVLENLNKEISSITSKTSINEKGYYDGLMFIAKVIKKAKQVYLDKMEREL